MAKLWRPLPTSLELCSRLMILQLLLVGPNMPESVSRSIYPNRLVVASGSVMIYTGCLLLYKREFADVLLFVRNDQSE